MGAEWPIMTIAECAAEVPYATQIGPFGKALMADEYTETGVPLLRGVNVNRGRFHDDDYVFISEETADRLAKYESFPGDVLLVHKGTLGQIGLMPVDRRYPRYIMGNSMLRVRCDERILLPEYLYYWLSSAAGYNYLLSRVSQVGVPQLQRPLTTLREAALPVPPITEQRAIAGVLGALDDKIELNRRMNATLEEMARAIFKAWFVDFEPVKAKATGATSFPGMPQDVFDGLPTSFTDSDLGPIPDGWSIGQLGDHCEVNRRSLRKQELPPEIEYIDISSVSVGRLVSPTFVRAADAPSRARRCVQHGDTIWSCVRPNRMSYLFIHSPPENRIVSTGFAVLTPTELEPAFLYQLVTRPEFVDYLVGNADGSAYPAVRADHFSIAPVLAPPASLRSAYNETAMPLHDQIACNERQSVVFAQIRDTLLPKLISGEMRVTLSKGAAEELA